MIKILLIAILFSSLKASFVLDLDEINPPIIDSYVIKENTTTPITPPKDNTTKPKIEPQIVEPKKVEKKFKVMIISGHVENPKLAGRNNVKGAKSYGGIYEYVFNDNIVKQFNNKNNQLPNVEYKVILATQNVGLKQRVYIANREFQANLYIEIHHDSATYPDIKKAKKEGLTSDMWNLIQGFSFHISSENPNFEKSLLFSKILGNIFLNHNLTSNQYHSVSSRRFVQLDKERGIYNRIKPHGLFVLYNINTPTVLVECATIANPYDEKYILNEENQKIFIESINLAIQEYIKTIEEKR